MRGDLGLMSSCHEGHGGNQHSSTLLDDTLDIIWVVDEGSDRSGPSDPPYYI